MVIIYLQAWHSNLTESKGVLLLEHLQVHPIPHIQTEQQGSLWFQWEQDWVIRRSAFRQREQVLLCILNGAKHNSHAKQTPNTNSNEETTCKCCGFYMIYLIKQYIFTDLKLPPEQPKTGRQLHVRRSTERLPCFKKAWWVQDSPCA